jgi:nicotinamidase-related amidase
MSPRTATTDLDTRSTNGCKVAFPGARRVATERIEEDGTTVGFEQGDALLVIDVLTDFSHEDGPSLLASFRDRGAAIAAAIESARDAGVPVVYINDDRDRWDGDAPALARESAEGTGGDVIRQLLPRTGDAILLKHRYSAFDHTALELLLEARSVERVLIVGAATEGCVVQTALDAREHGLKATIVADACATTDPELEQLALRYAREVGGIRVQPRSGHPGRRASTA